MKHTLNIEVRPTLRLGEIERLIRSHRLMTPPPSRRTLLNMCEDGTFETVGGEATRIGWLVFEDSFWKWVKDRGLAS